MGKAPCIYRDIVDCGGCGFVACYRGLLKLFFLQTRIIDTKFCHDSFFFNEIGFMGTRVRRVSDERGESGCVCVCTASDYDIHRPDFANGDGGCCVEDDVWSRVG